MRAMLVAAGFGTRLDPLTQELPKPAVPVANQPVAAFALQHLHRFGIRDFVVNTHHLAAALRAALEPRVPADARLRFVHEPTILGTGGGVRNAASQGAGGLEQELLVFSAKLVFAPDLERLLRVHRDSGAIATMCLRPLPPDAGFAPVELAADGRIRRIRGLPTGAGDGSLRAAMYTGVQVLSPRALAQLPAEGDIIERAYLPWLERGEVVMGVLDGGDWRDVGVGPQGYLEANLAFAQGQLRWPGLPEPVAGSFVAPDARVGAATRLQAVVAGAGAKIASGAVLERVVLWPGARAEGELRDAIVTTGGRVLRLGET
ncbi:MAG: NDP-sugar synthase [Myxococcales bacterium]|nr:NDP-sugar synthase [Myxococcales bacterium]